MGNTHARTHIHTSTPCFNFYPRFIRSLDPLERMRSQSVPSALRSAAAAAAAAAAAQTIIVKIRL